MSCKQVLPNLLFIVYFCKYLPHSQAFSLIRADYRVYVQVSHHSRGVVASACAFLAYMGAHQVENIYKDELYLYWFLISLNKLRNNSIDYVTPTSCRQHLCQMIQIDFMDHESLCVHCLYKIIFKQFYTSLYKQSNIYKLSCIWNHHVIFEYYLRNYTPYNLLSVIQKSLALEMVHGKLIDRNVTTLCKKHLIS